nr:3-phosphoshikimate 1-carboxyvinyltransferase [Pseudoalteromonas sp. Z9A5]
MPNNVQNTFTDEQLTHLKVAIGARQWGDHAVDFRGVAKVLKYRYYFVVLMGRNRRELSGKEKKISAIIQTCLISLFTFFIVIFLLLTIYLVKSALGIDLFEDYSLGVWSWFKGLLK